jgi:hypothetical protein
MTTINNTTQPFYMSVLFRRRGGERQLFETIVVFPVALMWAEGVNDLHVQFQGGEYYNILWSDLMPDAFDGEFHIPDGAMRLRAWLLDIHNGDIHPHFVGYSIHTHNEKHFLPNDSSTKSYLVPPDLVEEFVANFDSPNK